MKIVLASESPRREKLLKELGLDFEVIPSNSDEDSVKENNPLKLVQKIAALKANSVARKIGDGHIIIAADTVVVLDGKIIGKPRDRDEAHSMLGMLSGKKHTVHTGVCLINTSTGKVLQDSESSGVNFRSLTEDEIEMHASLDITLGCAGAYVVQSDPSPVASVEGSYTNVVSLPMEKLIPMLRENGINI